MWWWVLWWHKTRLLATRRVVWRSTPEEDVNFFAAFALTDPSLLLQRPLFSISHLSLRLLWHFERLQRLLEAPSPSLLLGAMLFFHRHITLHIFKYVVTLLYITWPVNTKKHFQRIFAKYGFFKKKNLFAIRVFLFLSAVSIHAASTLIDTQGDFGIKSEWLGR